SPNLVPRNACRGAREDTLFMLDLDGNRRSLSSRTIEGDLVFGQPSGAVERPVDVCDPGFGHGFQPARLPDGGGSVVEDDAWRAEPHPQSARVLDVCPVVENAYRDLVFDPTALGRVRYVDAERGRAAFVLPYEMPVHPDRRAVVHGTEPQPALFVA